MKWRSTHIGEFVDRGVANIQTGPFGTQLKASDYVADGIPVINVRNIGYGRLRENDLEHVTETTSERLVAHVLKHGDIVFGRKGAVDRHLLVQNGQAGWMQGSDCIRLRLATDEIEPKFLSYCFLSPSHQEWMLTQSSNKATMASLNQDIIKRIPIRVPSPQTQQDVVAILSAYDDLLENNARRIKLLEESARLLYEEWFVRLRFPGHEHTPIHNDLPKGWQAKVLCDLCQAVRETVHPNELEPDTPYIGLEHIPRRSITLGTWGRADEVDSTKHLYQTGDILFGKIRPYFHKVGVALTDGITSSDAIVIRPTSDELLPLVLLTTSSDHFVATASKTAREGSKMPRADWKLMQQFSVLLPPTPLLKAFNDFITPVLGQLKALTFANHKLQQARDLLLPRLMNGEIAV